MFLRGFFRGLLVPLRHFGTDTRADTGTAPGSGPRCATEDSGRGRVGVVGLRCDDVVDLPAEGAAGLHHERQQEAEDDVEGHQADKHTGRHLQTPHDRHGRAAWEPRSPNRAAPGQPLTMRMKRARLALSGSPWICNRKMSW